jgi:type IV secretory pathway VirB10-like protein
MRAIVVATALAALTVGLVIFIFVNLHEAKAPPSPAHAVGTSPAAIEPPPPSPLTAASTAAVHPPTAAPPPPTATAAPAAPAPSSLPVDPLDQVIQGKTRREWRATYAARQRRILSDMERHQAVIERAESGEEPDPTQLGEAHTRVRELKDELRRDLEELQRIESSNIDQPAP